MHTLARGYGDAAFTCPLVMSDAASDDGSEDSRFSGPNYLRNPLELPGRVVLDVGGTKFATTLWTLQRVHKSYFARRFRGVFDVASSNGEYFIDRSPKQFEYVLNYLRDGPCTPLPSEPSARIELTREAQYYMLPELEARLKSEISVRIQLGLNECTGGTCRCGAQFNKVIPARATPRFWNQHEFQVPPTNGTYLRPFERFVAECDGGYHSAAKIASQIIQISESADRTRHVPRETLAVTRALRNKITGFIRTCVCSDGSTTAQPLLARSTYGMGRHTRRREFACMPYWRTRKTKKELHYRGVLAVEVTA